MRKLTVRAKVSSLAIAVALVAGPSPAAAQFVGTINSSNGIDTVNSTNSNLIITGQQAVINWTATDTPTSGVISFLPDANGVTFSSGGDFAVLNRVTPGTANNAIYMGGSISSFAGDFTGGTVFFYSPNGIIIGQNASINVGSLGLTTLPISDDGEGNWMTGFGGPNPTVTFGQATNPNSFIRTDAVIDGSINAHGSGSYVALVAPIIQHRGVIRTDTAAALVAAEAATITFSPDGLFNISVTVGTDAATGIDVDGGKIERRSAAEGQPPDGPGNHYAYLVAVAKNDAVDMLIRNGGEVGFDTATSVSVEDNVVVLSGGRQIDTGQIDVPTGAAPVNLSIDGSTFTTDVIADVSGFADIRTNGGNTSFGLDPTSTSLNLRAGDDSIVTASFGNTLSIAGSLFASFDVSGTGALTTGNLFRLSTIGASTLTVGGNVSITAKTFGAGGEDVDGGDAVGGTAIVQTSSGGTIDIAGNLDINVDGEGGSVVGFGLAGGDGTGGTAHILANGGSGASLTVGGTVSVSADGLGGNIGDDCFSCSITGGNGTGGTILLQAMAGTGNALDLSNIVALRATGTGAAGDAAGGNATGGNIQLVVGDAGSITIGGDLGADASANGGFGMDNGVAGGQGGDATGGLVQFSFSGAVSSIDLNGLFSVFSTDAFGGNGVIGGDATGGFANLEVGSGGTLTANFLGGSANAFAGDSDAFNTGNTAAGGNATGGRAWLQVIGGGTVTVSELALGANGFGGEATGAGGNGTGGHVRANASAGSLTVANLIDLEANGEGGATGGDIAPGGAGQGGLAQIFASSGGLVDLNGSVFANANGNGGGSFDLTAQSGDGTGGQVILRADSGATIDAAFNVFLSADGFGGFTGGDCNDCGGAGGNGFGGTAEVRALGGAASLVRVGGTLDVSASGFGASGFGGAGGNGTGGTTTLAVQAGAAIDLLGDLFLAASGSGGWQTGGGVAGNGTGGLVDAFVGAAGGTLAVDGFTDFDASGTGGDAEGTGGVAGDGLGGTARYTGLGGTATFAGDLILRGTGTGGDAGDETANGTGGDGTGNIARIQAAGGDINIGGTASVSASGFGGSGITGGSGTGGGDFFANNGGAHIVAGNGDIVIGGAAVAMSDGVGGNGALGGNGGNGEGGWASIHAANSDGGPGSVTVQAVEAAAFVSANGVGGNGGDGVTGTDGTSGASGGNGGTGGAGGNGGTGTGGVAAITAAAGNGTLNIDFGFVDANGIGGAGGAGGTGGVGGFGSNGQGGNGGTGGIGGAGGAAFGGIAAIGVESGTGQAAGSNAGVANFVDMEGNVSATGGFGGTGGAGGAAGIGTPNGTAGASGNGGAGGDAEGGIVVLQARGGRVNIGSALLTSNATGGDGGSGGVAGAGGDAESDEAMVLVTHRGSDTTLRGRLNAGTINGLVTATGGNGSTIGASMMEGGSGFIVINGNARIDTLNITSTADGQIADLAPDKIELINADVRIFNGFSFDTDGVAAVYADNSTLNAPTFTVSASNFIHNPDQTGPAIVGTISADTFNFTTGQDLVIDAHLISTNSLNLIAPGLIDIRDATSGGDLTLQAGSTIDGGTQSAAGSVFAFAPGNITLNNVVAGDSISIESSGGNISLAFLSATNSIDLDADGNIGFADATADDFDFSAGGNVNGGDIIAGTQASGDAGGAVSLGDINVGILLPGGAAEQGFAVGIAAEGSISVGNVDADEAIGFATLGNLTTGNLNAGTDVLTMVGGNTTIASITTPGDGRTYHGDVQMFLDAGGPDDFDPSLVFAQTPVRSGGSYTVTGAISTGLLQVGAASISTGNITAFNGASLDAAGSVATGTIDTSSLDITAGTDISTGNIFAFGDVTMDAGGSILTGNIDAGSIDLLAGANITTGYLNTQIFDLLGGGGIGALLFPGASITLESGGNISTGNISSIDGVYLNAGGGIATGAIDAFDFVEAHAVNNLGTGTIDAGNYVLLTSDNGSIAIGNATTPGLFQAFAGTNLTTGNISALAINASAGGLATINGTWSAEEDVTLTSNDIDIAATGGIDAGSVALVSSNATQTVVGDGVAGGGYQLSNAEYNRISVIGEIEVGADAGLGAASKMLIGDLSVTNNGENFVEYEFATYNGESEDSGIGSIRVMGDAVFTGPGVDFVSFTTGTFELDAATGLLSLQASPGVLGGELFLEANHIHVASGDILDQLADDPQYEGYQQDLNAPAAVQRPDGVIRAGSVEIEFGEAELNTLFVQNTGSAELPAGFLISDLNLGDDGEVTLPANSIDLIINGQIVTQAGTLTGIDVRDLLVEGRDLAPFTANSTINGCLLVGPCIDQGPFPPGFTPTPGLPEEFELFNDEQLPPPDFGNEDFIDDNIETTAEGATSPIKPPQPLFDTSALSDKGDVDDPVSGSGNPALMETPAGKTVCPAGSQANVPCKEDTQ